MSDRPRIQVCQSDINDVHNAAMNNAAVEMQTVCAVIVDLYERMRTPAGNVESAEDFVTNCNRHCLSSQDMASAIRAREAAICADLAATKRKADAYDALGPNPEAAVKGARTALLHAERSMKEMADTHRMDTPSSCTEIAELCRAALAALGGGK